MPVEFLSDEQAAAFGRYVGEPAQADLQRFFFLDDVDLELVGRRRGEHNRRGFAVQLGTVRFLGRFLPDPLDAPWAVVEYLAGQLGVEDPSVAKQYAQRLPTQHEHAAEIAAAYGYRDFSEPAAAAELRGFVAGRAWTHAESQLALFAPATAWLRRHRVLLPGPSVLARLVASVQEEAASRLHASLVDAARAADPGLPGRLRDLLRVEERARHSRLELLRRPPTRTSGRAMVEALTRAQDVLAVGARAADVEAVPAGRLGLLARYGLAAKASTIGGLAEPRRTATLLATARALETSAVDDALDLFDVLMATRLIGAARRASAADRLASLPRLERASATLAAAARAVLAVLERTRSQDGERGGGLDVAAAWAAVEQAVPRHEVAGAAAVVEELVPGALAMQGRVDPAEDALRAALTGKYAVVRPFLRLLADALPLRAIPAARPLLAQVRRLPDLARRQVAVRPMLAGEVDPAVVPPAWRRAVFAAVGVGDGAVDRDAYVVCVLEQLHTALRRRDVFAVPSVRWADPRAQLLDGAAWDAVRDEVLTGLGLSGAVEEHLGELAGALDAAWRQLGDHLAEAGPDTTVRLTPTPGDDGRVRLAVDRLGAVGEPATLSELRACVAAMLPRVDLPEVLLEVHAWTGFLDEYSHVGHLAPRMDGLPVSVAALLVAQACNVGLTPVAKPEVAALTRDRLSHVDQNYLRAETHSAANARLIDAQAAVEVATAWGGGLVASVDGLRFVVPVQSIVTAPSPRCFGLRRGVTWLNAVNDQVAGIGAVVVPGTMRDSLHILDALLGLDGGPKPDLVATDTASYPVATFGLFDLLGLAFSPHIRDLPRLQLHRLGAAGEYARRWPHAGPLLTQPVQTSLIAEAWPDLLRLAGSMKFGHAAASLLVAKLHASARQNALARALHEYGRLVRTIYVCRYLTDLALRRRVRRQLNKGESLHALRRRLFFAHQGQVRRRHLDDQVDQALCTTVVLNAVVVWNTAYLGDALDRLRAGGFPVTDEAVAHLSPARDDHLNPYGSYAFDVAAELDRPGRRPLRRSAAAP